MSLFHCSTKTVCSVNKRHEFHLQWRVLTNRLKRPDGPPPSVGNVLFAPGQAMTISLPEGSLGQPRCSLGGVKGRPPSLVELRRSNFHFNVTLLIYQRCNVHGTKGFKCSSYITRTPLPPPGWWSTLLLHTLLSVALSSNNSACRP